MNPRFHAPLPHPRRDPYLRRARFLAAGILATAQALWFLGFFLAVRDGAKLSPLFSFTGIAGLFLIGARAREVSELSLGFVDRMARMEFAPTFPAIFSRLAVTCVLPSLCMLTALYFRTHVSITRIALAFLLFSEIGFRFGGWRVWRELRIRPLILKPLLVSNSVSAMNALATQQPADDPGTELTILAVSSAAIEERNIAVLHRLTEFLNALATTGPMKTRLLAILDADRSTLLNQDDALTLQAQALMLLPPGHPRRSSLALLVATSALEEGDFANAAKALLLLHSRDVLTSLPRLLIDWLIGHAAAQSQSADLAASASLAIRTFDLRRILRQLNVEELGRRDDAYARWICRANTDLLARLQPTERISTPPAS